MASCMAFSTDAGSLRARNVRITVLDCWYMYITDIVAKMVMIAQRMEYQ